MPTDKDAVVVDLGNVRAVRDLDTLPEYARVCVDWAGDGRRLMVWTAEGPNDREWRWLIGELWDVIQDIGEERGIDVFEVLAPSEGASSAEGDR